MNETEKEAKKLILKYYEQPRNYVDFQNFIFQLHEQLIDDKELVIKTDGVFKTKILGNT